MFIQGLISLFIDFVQLLDSESEGFIAQKVPSCCITCTKGVCFRLWGNTKESVFYQLRTYFMYSTDRIYLYIYPEACFWYFCLQSYPDTVWSSDPQHVWLRSKDMFFFFFWPLRFILVGPKPKIYSRCSILMMMGVNSKFYGPIQSKSDIICAVHLFIFLADLRTCITRFL